MWVAFANAKATHISSAKIVAYMLYLMIKVLTLTNDIVSFKQLSPGYKIDQTRQGARIYEGQPALQIRLFVHSHNDPW